MKEVNIFYFGTNAAWASIWVSHPIKNWETVINKSMFLSTPLHFLLQMCGDCEEKKIY